MMAFMEHDLLYTALQREVLRFDGLLALLE
jgi:hypothetical protein